MQAASASLVVGPSSNFAPPLSLLCTAGAIEPHSSCCCCSCSPFWHVALDTGAALHRVLERAELLRVLSAARAEVTLRRRSVLRYALRSEATAHVIRLVLVELLLHGFAGGRLWEGPPGHGPLIRGVCRVFWGVTAGTD